MCFIFFALPYDLISIPMWTFYRFPKIEHYFLTSLPLWPCLWCNLAGKSRPLFTTQRSVYLLQLPIRHPHLDVLKATQVQRFQNQAQESFSPFQSDSTVLYQNEWTHPLVCYIKQTHTWGKNFLCGGNPLCNGGNSFSFMTGVRHPLIIRKSWDRTRQRSTLRALCLL